MNRCRVRCLVLATAVASAAFGHDGPIQLPPPQSAEEAWNVLRLSAANVETLIPQNLPRDVAAQLGNIALALPTLRVDAARAAAVDALAVDTLATLAAVRAADAGRALPAAWAHWTRDRDALARSFPAGTVAAEVYTCPMHPAERHLNASDGCSVCGMPLVVRRLPASAVYQKPGEPTLAMTLRAPPLVVGLRTDVVLKLARPDGRPVTSADLLVAHTQRVHLLINDRSLSDYHHEHPKPTNVDGEYAFSFTPRKPGPYRVWADVVPAVSGVQEYDVGDLPAGTASLPLTDRRTTLTATVDGRRFDLAFDTAGRPPRAGEAVVGTVAVADADGRGFTKLEPVMGAFAHLVGFGEDGRSVLHIHPYGKPPGGPADRAGPAFAFKFYAPAAGVWRLYCQVQIDGRPVFAPFTLGVAGPATKPAMKNP